MRTRFTLGFCLLFAASAALAGTTGNLSPAQVFAQASPSIVVVEALDQDGQALYQGSGVVIHKGVVVSNCHVFTHDHVNTAIVRYQKKTYSATLRYADVAHDLCSFNVKGLPAPPIRLGSTSGLKVGEKAYAIGAPEGLDLSLSGGLISSLRHIADGTVIQMTTPISPGSSGGGLFDSHARLIGITSYYMKEGEQLNFAVPVEWVKALPRRGETPRQLVEQKSTRSAEFQRALKAYLNGDYVTAFSAFISLAKSGNTDAQYALGVMYSRGEGIPQNYDKAQYWYSKAAEEGSARAQNNLGAMYAYGKGVPQDSGKALYWYSKAAEQGDARAQFNLGGLYARGEGVPQDFGKAAYWTRKAAVQGYAMAQDVLGISYEYGIGLPQDYRQAAHWYLEAASHGIAKAQEAIGKMYATGRGVARDDGLALYWFRRAAAQGLASAQTSLGAAYGLGRGVSRDYVQAAKWYILGQAGGDKTAKKLLPLVEDDLSPRQIAEAQRLAREWWAKHHKQ